MSLATQKEFRNYSRDMDHHSANILKTGYVLNDKWVIIELIGKGAMGEVYRAHQLNLKRDVAIKVISQEMLSSLEDDTDEVETAFQRFRREVQTMARVRHSNVLQIFDYGSEKIIQDGQDVAVEYIVMEYIPGATLRYTMSESGFAPEHDLIAAWLVDYFLPLLEGVEAIHAQDIVHRDLKPENILLDDTIPKVADFGLACSTCMLHVTRSVDVRGTPAYMSPEHFFELKKADRQSDIYSLGKILYEAIEGQITSKVLPFQRVFLSNPDTPFLQKLDRIVQDATVEEKENRLKSVAELRSALLEALELLKRPIVPDDPEVPKHPVFLQRPGFVWTGIIVAIVSVVLMGLWHLTGEPGKTRKPLRSQDSAQETALLSNTDSLSKTEPASASFSVPSIMGKDGKTMLFVSEGKVQANIEGAGSQPQTVQIHSFYLDKEMVTNHHFAEFLNEVKDHLTIENGIVRKNDEIWFYLGNDEEAHEQIIYQHGRFHLRDTQYASLPVVRVTWYGASAYARYYDKRLLSEHEWDYVFLNTGILKKFVSSDTRKTAGSAEIHPHMMHMDTSADSKETEVNPLLGAGGENGATNHVAPGDSFIPENLEKHYREWVAREDTIQGNHNADETQADIAYQSLVAVRSAGSGAGLKTFRYPWEAFSDVGFRCAQKL